MITKTCAMCGDEIKQLYQQFGDIGEEVCIVCWLKHGVDCVLKTWYGLGPHVHTYDDIGNIVIGGTQFLPLEEYEKKNNSYLINGFRFIPDTDAPGLGMWSRK